MRPLAMLLSLACAVPALAAPTPDRATSRPSCEPFTDPRELRFRTPAATVSGQIAAGTTAEPGMESPEAGQQLVFGSAELIDDATGTRRRISYAYWNTTGGCGGWEPSRGARYTFDLADDKAADGALRVMRYVTELGARR
jgi:hypothetical protein